MRRTSQLVSRLLLATTLAGCADNAPTATRRAIFTPQLDILATPQDGGLISSSVVAIAQAGREVHPRVRGDVVCWSEILTGTVQYTPLLSGVISTVPADEEQVGTRDDQCATSGQFIAFRRSGNSESRIFVYNWPNSSLYELDPQPTPNRELPSIGTASVAFLDQDADGNSFIRVLCPLPSCAGNAVYVQTAGTVVPHRGPSVSPSGQWIVWQECDVACRAMKAFGGGLVWSSPALVMPTGANEDEDEPVTDGSYVVFDSDRPGGTGRDIYITNLGGSFLTQLALPGDQARPRIASGVVAFASVDPVSFQVDVFVYVIATNTLFRVTNDPAFESEHDVDVRSNGDIVVVWSSDLGLGTGPDVFATIFNPAPAPVFSFGGFLAPVNKPPTVNLAKAGAAVPVKFSLGGDRGLTIFAGGSPSSVAVTCNLGAPTDAVEETLTAGNSTLTYDATSDTYSYIWKTDKTWANTCRKLTLQFVDGTVASADFQFAK